jgi:RNA polymerase sigma factor (TIGR02999 family)
MLAQHTSVTESAHKFQRAPPDVYPIVGCGVAWFRGIIDIVTNATPILASIEDGDPMAAASLLPLLYDELRQLAAAKLAHESPGQTLQPTALVHEAYLRLCSGDAAAWEGRRHFFGAAAEAMRRILVERARRRTSIKGGGGLRRIDLDEGLFIGQERANEVLALDEALAALEIHDPQAAHVVKLRYFAGLSHQDAAAAMNITRRTADRLWALAKAWLYQRVSAK